MKKFEKRIKEDLDDLGLSDVALVIEAVYPHNVPLLSISRIKDGSLVDTPMNYATDEFKLYQIYELDYMLRFLGNKIVYYSNGEVTIKENENE